MSGRHGEAVQKRRSRRRRQLAAALIIVAAGLIVARPAPTQTEANWVDSEYANASFTALTVPPVTMTGCGVNTGLLGALGSFSVTFQLPSGYVIGNVSYAVANNAAMTGATTSSPTVSGPVAGTYTATFGTGLLGLLGSDVYLGVIVSQPNTSPTWTSPYKVAHGVVALLALNSTCAPI